MFRDDRSAMAQQNQQLSREAEVLRKDNLAMREEILAMRRGGGGVTSVYNVYNSDVSQLSPGEKAALSHHTVTPFPVWGIALLHLLTFGLFPLIHFGLHHDKLPQAAPNDPTAGKAIGFSFIPYFNLYWVFFNSMRLADRLNLQFRLRGMEEKAPKGLMIACSVLGVIPYVNIFIGFPIMWTIGVCFLQSACNQVAALGPLDPGAPGQKALDPYAQPPAGLLPGI
jgi:hypothetical protein